MMIRRIFVILLACLLALLPAMAEDSFELPADAQLKPGASSEQVAASAEIAGQMSQGLRAGAGVKAAATEEQIEAGSAIAEEIHDEAATKANMSGLSIPATSDVVTVGDDGAVTVTTDEVTMTVLPPFGFVAVGQDILAQLDVYANFNNPLGIAAELQAMGVNMYILDLATDMQIMVSTSHDVASTIIEDIDEVEKGMLGLIVDAIQNMEPSLELSVRECGENTFIRFDYRPSGDESMIYTTIKGNTNIDFLLLPSGDAITDDEIETMEYLLADAAFAAA